MQSKAYRVILYVNGDYLTPGVRILLNHRTCQTFGQLLRLTAETVKIQTSVRKLYNAKNGRPITHLRELEDGMSIACAGTGSFRRVAYKPKTAIDNGQAQRASHEVNVSSPKTQVRRTVNFFPNGDGQHTGFVVSIQHSRFPTVKKLLTYINEKYTLVSGQCRRIYSPDGSVISIIDDMEHGKDYILVSGDDQFYRIPYNINSMVKSTGPRGMAGYTQNNELMGQIKLARPMWAVQADRRAAAKQAAGDRTVFNGVKKPIAKAPIKQKNHQEIQEEFDDVQDDEDAVFESTEIAQFNAESEDVDQYEEDDAEDFELGPG
jgi:hypothetical protein